MRTTGSFLLAGSALAVAIFVGACSSAGGQATPTSASGPSLSATVETPNASLSVISGSELPIGGAEAVSASRPSAEALDVFTKCHIGDHDLVALGRVTGMGKLASTKDITRYVPLTGREPQLAETG